MANEEKKVWTVEEAFSSPNGKGLNQEMILDWCEENNQLEWLETLVNQKITVNKYPTKTYTGKDGKKHIVQDKSKAPTGTEVINIPFVQIRLAFVEKFFPELITEAKPKKPSFKDAIKARKAAK